MNDDFIPVIGVIGILIVVFGFIATMRFLNFQETLALAEKGITRPEPKNGKGFLRWGIVIASFGLALTIGLYPLGFDSGNEFPLHLGPWMLGGFIPLFLGLGFILIHYLTEKE